jgi:dTDP-4-dehydrorhamnose reductase
MILIFGASGQFGTNFVKACDIRQLTYKCIAHNEIDIADEPSVAKLIARLRPAAVINATGIVDIQRCEADPSLAFAVNATAVRGLALACAETGAILIQTSTHLVFDGLKNAPYLESDLPSPNTIYAASKLAGECLALRLCPKTYVVRFPTLYGERRNDAQGFVEKMIDRLRSGAPLRIADDRIDTPTWARDAADAVLALVARGADFGTYHIANTGAVSYFEFINYLARLIGSKSTVEPAKDADFPSSPPKPLRVPLATARMPALRPWREALADYCDTI